MLDRQEGLVKHTIRETNADPLRQCTFEPDTAIPISVGNRRVGRPRDRWAFSNLERMCVKYFHESKQYFKRNLASACTQIEGRVRSRQI